MNLNPGDIVVLLIHGQEQGNLIFLGRLFYDIERKRMVDLNPFFLYPAIGAALYLIQ